MGGGGAGRTGVLLDLVSGSFLLASGLEGLAGAEDRRRIAVGLGFNWDISGDLPLVTLVFGDELFLEEMEECAKPLL